MLHSREHPELLQLLAQDPDAAWADAINVWKSAPRVYAGPSGPDGFVHPAFDLVQLAPMHIGHIESRLTEGLHHENPNVVAYCALTLWAMNDHELPRRHIEIVADRDEILDVSDGCFGLRPTLAEFVADLE